MERGNTEVHKTKGGGVWGGGGEMNKMEKDDIVSTISYWMTHVMNMDAIGHTRFKHHQ